MEKIKNPTTVDNSSPEMQRLQLAHRYNDLVDKYEALEKEYEALKKKHTSKKKDGISDSVDAPKDTEVSPDKKTQEEKTSDTEK